VINSIGSFLLERLVRVAVAGLLLPLLFIKAMLFVLFTNKDAKVTIE